VNAADLNVAEQILLDPRDRFAEELLEHASERLPLERLKKLLAEAAAVMATEAEPQVARSTNLSSLEPLGAAVVREFLDNNPSPDPSFGALETRLFPPFGNINEDR
jgi:hypothetical protein